MKPSFGFVHILEVRRIDDFSLRRRGTRCEGYLSTMEEHGPQKREVRMQVAAMRRSRRTLTRGVSTSQRPWRSSLVYTRGSTRSSSYVSLFGLTMEQIAEHVALSLSQVEKDWRVARAWLYGRLMMAS